jgi:hypothetical protein
MTQHSGWCRVKLTRRWWQGFNNNHIQEMCLDIFTAVYFENSILLGYNSMLLGNWILTLQRNAMPLQHQELITQWCSGYSLIHSIGMCRMQWFLAVLRSFFHSSMLYTFSCHSSPPTILPSSLISSCHLFLGLPLGLAVSKFIYNTLLGTLFSSILCTCPSQHNICSFIVSVMASF